MLVQPPGVGGQGLPQDVEVVDRSIEAPPTLIAETSLPPPAVRDVLRPSRTELR
jgi:hypothetical protein